MPPKLYKMDLSPPCRAVYLTAAALGIKLDYVEINFVDKQNLTPEYIKLNPQHTVPTMEDQGNIIWDSHAIMTYLVTVYGKDDSLYPKDPIKRAVVDQRLHFDTGMVFPLISRIMKPLRLKGVKTISQEIIDQINISYDFLDTFLKEHKWVAGDNITLADFSLLSSATSIDILVPIDASKYPNILGWIERAEQLPYYNVNQKGLVDLRALVKRLQS